MTSHQSSASKKAAKYDFLIALKSVLVPTVMTFFVSVCAFMIAPLVEFMYQLSAANMNREQLRKNVVMILVSADTSIFFDYDYGIVVGLVFIILGALFALFSFRFIMRKKMINVFFSMGIDRKTLFKNRVLASLAMLAAMIALPLIADIFMNIYLVGNFGYVLKCALLLFLECFVYTAVGFSVMAITMTVCSTIVESSFFCVGILCAPTVIVNFIDSLCSTFLRGYNHSSLAIDYYTAYNGYYFSRPSLFHYTSIINPLILGKAYGAEHGIYENIINFTYRLNDYSTSDYIDEAVAQSLNTKYGNVPFDYILPVIVWAVICSCLIAAAGKLFVKIKAENAGTHGANILVSRLFAAECAVTLFALWISNISLNYSGENSLLSNSVFVTAAGAVILLISYLIIISICKRTVKHKVKELIAPGASIVVSVVLVSVFSAGFFGFSAYVPEPEEVDRAVITTGATNIASSEILSEPYEDSYYGDIFEMFADNAIGVFTEEEDLQTLTDINKNLTRETDNMTGNGVYVCYELKSGKTVSRYYESTDYDACYSILSLRDSRAAQEELTYFLTGDSKEQPMTEKLKGSSIDSNEVFLYESERGTAKAVQNGYVYAVDANNICKYNTIKNTPELRQALLDDLLSQTWQQRFSPEETAIGGLYFSNISYDDDDMMMDNSYAYITDIGYYIYPSMTNTVAYLKSTGEYELFKMNDQIESVTVRRCGDIRESQFESWGADSFVLHQFVSKNQIVYDNNEYMDEDYYYDYTLDISAYFTDGITVEDAQQMNELADKARIFYYADNGDYVVLIKYKNAGYVTKLIPKEELPESVTAAETA